MKEQNSGKALPLSLRMTSSPHIKSPDSTRGIMLDVIVALLPAFVWGVYMSGTRALAICLIAIISCVGFEALAQLIMKRPVTVSDLSAVVTGLLLTMCLPVTIPLWMPVVGAFFAIVVVKQIFGGIGKNIVNPALAARVFLFSWAGSMTSYVAPGVKVNSLAITLTDVEAVSAATPLATLGLEKLPDATMGDMLLGNIGGSIGETSALLLIFGGIYLLIRRVITWQIPVAYIGAVAGLTYLFPKAGASVDFMLYEILAGGLILGAFFMATDYATSPITPLGRFIYGLGCGAITVLIRFFGVYPEGVSFAILIMNLLVWYLDLIGIPKRFGDIKQQTKKPKEG